MIPTLLWRCPMCATNDALTHRRLPLLPEKVSCRSCHTTWRVRRVMGDDYYLRVVTGAPEWMGTELSLAEWYDRMKATLALVPLQDSSLELAEGEVLYLKSGRVRLAAENDDPLFFRQAGDGPEREVADKMRAIQRRVGQGQLFLTNERLIWRQAGKQQDFWLQKLNSLDATWFGLSMLYGTRLYLLGFKDESVLKWVTYFGHVAEQVKATTGHLITISEY